MTVQWTVIVIGIAVIAFGFFRSRGARARQSMDGQTLIQLVKAGSDLKKPHDIDFFYFPTEEQVKEAAPRLEALGVSTKTKLSAKHSNWVIHGNKTMVHTEAELERLRQLFNDIATAQGVDYDGWGAEVVG